MKNLSLVFFAIVAIWLFVDVVNGQDSPQFRQPIPAAPGKSIKVRPATSDEVNLASALMSRQSVSGKTDKTADLGMGGQNRPLFVVHVAGDSWDNGVTVNAMSVEDIPANSTLFGTIVNPDGTEKNLFAWQTQENIPAGNIWYNFENQRKPGYNEQHGPVQYKMTVIVGNRVRVFTANANLGYSGSSGPQFIEDGVAVNNGWAPKFYLFGNFGTGVGVVMKIANSYTLTIPAEAITFHRRVIEIDTSKIVGPYFGIGDYIFSVANSSGMTDNGYTVRVMNNQQNLAQSEQRLKFLLEAYSK